MKRLLFSLVGFLLLSNLSSLHAQAAPEKEKPAPTIAELAEELKKVKRVIGKVLPGAPHHTLLVLDGNTGQNGLSQVKAFHAALGLTGIIVTKLDGTAKGGVICALAHTLQEGPKPSVLALGKGEGIDDLAPFTAGQYASELFN